MGSELHSVSRECFKNLFRSVLYDPVFLNHMQTKLNWFLPKGNQGYWVLKVNLDRLRKQLTIMDNVRKKRPLRLKDVANLIKFSQLQVRFFDVAFFGEWFGRGTLGAEFLDETMRLVTEAPRYAVCVHAYSLWLGDDGVPRSSHHTEVFIAPADLVGFGTWVNNNNNNTPNPESEGEREREREREEEENSGLKDE